jgi:hypothetical protein
MTATVSAHASSIRRMHANDRKLTSRDSSGIDILVVRGLPAPGS